MIEEEAAEASGVILFAVTCRNPYFCNVGQKTRSLILTLGEKRIHWVLETWRISTTSATATSLRSPTTPHLHIANEVCPWCEQPIPHDKFSEISARIAEREGAHFTEMTTALKEQHARD